MLARKEGQRRPINDQVGVVGWLTTTFRYLQFVFKQNNQNNNVLIGQNNNNNSSSHYLKLVLTVNTVNVIF